MNTEQTSENIFTYNVKSLVSTNEQLTSELTVLENVNNIL